MGVAIKEDGETVGFFQPKKTPHLVNLNPDSSLSECLLYYLKVIIRRMKDEEILKNDFNSSLAQPKWVHQKPIFPRIFNLWALILPAIIVFLKTPTVRVRKHQACHFMRKLENKLVLQSFEFSGIVKMIPCSDALCYVNGRKVAEPVVLKSGSRVILGKNHVFRFHHPEQVTKILEEKRENENVKDVDWEYAQSELLEREGVDLKLEMETKMKEMEDLWKKEKEEATQAFQQERKKYEDQIETLQKQVMEQSMTMSMMSSVTPDDFNQDDDLYGKPWLAATEITWNKIFLFNF